MGHLHQGEIIKIEKIKLPIAEMMNVSDAIQGIFEDI